MIELVLDTNILVAGLRSRRGASYQLLRSLAGNELRLNISVALALEYEDVLNRPGLVTGLTQSELDAFLDYVLSISTLWPSVPRVRPSLRDPDDERILELAVQSRARIVTHNTRDFQGARRFGVLVITPAEVVDEMRRKGI